MNNIGIILFPTVTIGIEFDKGHQTKILKIHEKTPHESDFVRRFAVKYPVAYASGSVRRKAVTEPEA